jgi:hypothetical protein
MFQGVCLTHYAFFFLIFLPQTLYRANELSEWRKFDHPNITALLMVTGLEIGHHCCQFMSLMDGESLLLLNVLYTYVLCILNDIYWLHEDVKYAVMNN